MRHNQNARRPQRGRSSGGGHSGGGNNSSSHHHSNNGQQNGRRVNPRIQTFDSNGPEVRIRGTAYQINEKYVTLARDATSAGDRVLAESYLQHAEHYQRFINEMTEEYNLQNPQQQLQPQIQPQMDGGMASPEAGTSLNDLDQGFLVGPRHIPQPNTNLADAPQPSIAVAGTSEPRDEQQQGSRHRGGRPHYIPRRNETETV